MSKIYDDLMLFNKQTQSNNMNDEHECVQVCLFTQWQIVLLVILVVIIVNANNNNNKHCHVWLGDKPNVHQSAKQTFKSVILC